MLRYLPFDEKPVYFIDTEGHPKNCECPGCIPGVETCPVVPVKNVKTGRMELMRLGYKTLDDILSGGLAAGEVLTLVGDDCADQIVDKK